MDNAPHTPAGHVAETVRSIAELRADHRRRSTPLERLADRLTGLFGRPFIIVILTICVAAWIGGNLLAQHLGFRPADPPPFFWLEAVVSLASLYLVILVLASQRREDELEQRRELLGLELAILSEQKTAKVIELLEEFRRDSPHLPDRIDGEAERMATPADPQSVISDLTEVNLENGPAEPAPPNNSQDVPKPAAASLPRHLRPQQEWSEDFLPSDRRPGL
jgi:uncharacterized membrane protein